MAPAAGHTHDAQPATARPVERHSDGNVAREADLLAVEAPMEIRLSGTPLAVLMRTPGRDQDLITGFLLTEGIVIEPAEIAAIEAEDDGDRWAVTLADGVVVDPEQFRRNTYTTSSCGVCGKASIDAVLVAARTPPPGPTVDAGLITSLPARMRRRQQTFEATGGLHAAAAFAAGGELLDIAEDIGRHNAMDKLVGRLATSSWPLGEVVIVVSGRVSFELAQKAAVAGAPILCGVSAASSLAVDLAVDSGLTLIGFLRDGGFNVYAGRQRLSDPGP